MVAKWQLETVSSLDNNHFLFIHLCIQNFEYMLCEDTAGISVDNAKTDQMWLNHLLSYKKMKIFK